MIISAALTACGAPWGGGTGPTGPASESLHAEVLEGDYQEIANCAYRTLTRTISGVRKTDMRGSKTSRIAPQATGAAGWELTFTASDQGSTTAFRYAWAPGSARSQQVLDAVHACSAI